MPRGAGPPSASRASRRWSSRPCSGRAGHAGRSGGHPGSDLSRRVHRSQGGVSEAPHANYTTSIALVAFQEANGTADTTARSRPARTSSRRCSGTSPKARAATTPSTAARATAAATAGPTFQHGLLHGSPARHRPARRRPELEEGPGLRLAMPEPQERVQRPGLGRKVNDGGFVYTHRQRRQSMAGKKAEAASAPMPA